MEHGFYHLTLGYWQTVSTPSDEHLASYPEGTFVVPLKPGRDFIWDGSQWVAVAPIPPTPEQLSALRAEAYRAEADPLFFKAQRGEATMDEWLAKVAEIKSRYPYPEEV
jgi:hypothetical protein